MKRCPRCSQVYSDEMAFCLSDGTPLVSAAGDREEPTVVRRPKAAGSGGVSSFLKYLVAGGLLLVIVFVLGIAGLFIFWPRDKAVTNIGDPPRNAPDVAVTQAPVRSPGRSSPATPSNETPPSQTREDEQANIRAQQEALEKERQKLAEERRRLEQEKHDSVEPARPEPSFVDPGTVRINFRRGSIGETVSGTIGSSRNFVLRTLGGQYLTASVRSAGGCAVFSNGSASTGFVTSAGDTYLYLRNNCSSPAKFSMSVAVR